MAGARRVQRDLTSAPAIAAYIHSVARHFRRHQKQDLVLDDAAGLEALLQDVDCSGLVETTLHRAQEGSAMGHFVDHKARPVQDCGELLDAARAGFEAGNAAGALACRDDEHEVPLPGGGRACAPNDGKMKGIL